MICDLYRQRSIMDELLNTSESRFDKQPSCLLQDSPFYLAHVWETKTFCTVKYFQWTKQVFREQLLPHHQDILKIIDQLTEVIQCDTVSKILLLSFYSVQTLFVLLPYARTHPVASNDLSTVVEERAGTELLSSLIEADAVPDINKWHNSFFTSVKTGKSVVSNQKALLNHSPML